MFNNQHPRRYLDIFIITVFLMLTLFSYGEEPAASLPGVLSVNALGAGKNLIIRFNRPLGTAAKLEQNPIPDIRFEPEQKGTFAWISATELAFTPAKGYLNGGHEVTVHINSSPTAGKKQRALCQPANEKFTVPFFQVAGKVASWPVIPGQPRFIGFLNRPGFSREVGAGPVFLLYDQAVKAKTVKNHLVIKDDKGENLQFQVFRPADSNKAIGAKIEENLLVGVRIINLPAHKSKLTVHIPDWQESKPGSRAYDFTVNSRFEIYNKEFFGGRDGDFVALDCTWYFAFNNPFRLSQMQDAIRLTPEPGKLEVSGFSRQQIRIRAKLKPGTRYRLSIAKDVTDTLGNRLETAVDIPFDSQDLPPILQVPAKQVIMERKTARIPVKARNADLVDIRVYPFTSVPAYCRALGMGHQTGSRGYGLKGSGTPIRQAQGKAPANKLKTFDINVAGQQGLLCLEVDARGTGSEAKGIITDAVLVQATDLGITAKITDGQVFAWVTRLHDAEPVEDAKVTLFSANGETLTTEKTDGFGTVLLGANNLATAAGLTENLYITAEKNKDIAVLPLTNKELSQPQQFGLKGTVAGGKGMRAALFTERGVYRPGETVHIKLIAATPGPQASKQVSLLVRDPHGQKVSEKTLDLDTYGTAQFDLQTGKNDPVGRYSIQVSRQQNAKTSGQDLVSCNFRVEEYRIPTFQVKVTSNTKKWQMGKKIDAAISAEYLHGGKLGNREVRWEVIRQPQVFRPASFPLYRFTMGENANLAGRVASGEQRLNEQGKLAIHFTPDHAPGAGPMSYTIESTVTDVDRQTYAGRLAKTVHPADIYVGVCPPQRNIWTAGEKMRVPVIAVRPDGRPVVGTKVEVTLERIDHHTAARLGVDSTVQMLNRQVAVKVQRLTMTTKATGVDCTFKLPQAGYYRCTATAKDNQHREVQAGFVVTVPGDQPVAWPRFDQDRIDILADKDKYKPGDTAHIVVQTPYKKARGLLTVERDHIIDYHVFEINNDTPALSIPIEKIHTPNIFVSVILLRGRLHNKKDASGYETGAPGFKIGCTRLDVEPVHHRLAVQVEPAHKTAHPGQEMTVGLTIRDNTGKPLAGQAAVMVVDEAVLGLTGFCTPDPVAQIYKKLPWGVRTASSRLDLPHARRARLEQIFPGGDGVDRLAMIDFPMSLRKLFKSTAYWNPQVPIDHTGKGTITFELPDNLTTYRVMAVVTDGHSRFGSGDRQVQVRKPLMIQPVIPRFLYPGDELQVEALVFNGTDTNDEVQLKAEFEGLQIIEKKKNSTLKTNKSFDQTFSKVWPPAGSGKKISTVPAGKSRSIKFWVKVSETAREEAVIRFAGSLGGHSTDAVEVKVPILETGTKRVIVINQSVQDETRVPVVIPAARLAGSVKMEIVTSTTVLSELKDAVRYLLRYPHGCIEQTTSTAYPLVVLADLLPEIGVEVDRDKLQELSTAGIQRILSFQTPAGGLSYWPGSSTPHAFGTAFGLTALIAAKQRGYHVPGEALERMADFLEQTLRKKDVTERIAHGNIPDEDTRALFVMTLGRLGRPQPGYISTLWRNKKNLSPFGLSFLAIAVKEMKGDQSLLKNILDEIRTAAQEDKKEAYFTGNRKGGWSFGSPLRTHGGALIAYALGAGTDPLSAKLLTGLLSRRQGGLWGNTQENVFGIMGVHAIAGKKTGGNGPKMELTVNGKAFPAESMEKLSPRSQRLRLTGADLGLQLGKEQTVDILLRNNGGSPVVLITRVQYQEHLNAENRRARSNGFLLTHSYETMKGESLEGKSIPLGSLVRVRVGIQTSKLHHYVAIDDKLPAGLEPLNTELETTQRVENITGQSRNNIQEQSLKRLSYKEIRDSRVLFYVDEMPAGTYEYIYIARATTPGRFLRAASRVEAMYEPECCGTTAISELTIK